MSVKIFITGGTFDKEYDEINGKLFFKDTHMREMLDLGRAKIDVKIRTLISFDLEKAPEPKRREKKNSEEEQIEHISEVRPSTEETEAKNMEDKIIILTGAMIPYTFGSSSDGFFNLGSAMAYVRILEPGVYIAMNGMLFNWNEVQKNKTLGFFEDIEPTE